MTLIYEILSSLCKEDNSYLFSLRYGYWLSGVMTLVFWSNELIDNKIINFIRPFDIKILLLILYVTSWYDNISKKFLPFSCITVLYCYIKIMINTTVNQVLVFPLVYVALWIGFLPCICFICSCGAKLANKISCQQKLWTVLFLRLVILPKIKCTRKLLYLQLSYQCSLHTYWFSFFN